MLQNFADETELKKVYFVSGQIKDTTKIGLVKEENLNYVLAKIEKLSSCYLYSLEMAQTPQATKHKHVKEILNEIIDEIPCMEVARKQKLVQTSMEPFVLTTRATEANKHLQDKVVNKQKLVQIPMEHFVLPKRVFEAKWSAEDEVFNMMMPDDDEDLVRALEYEETLFKDSKTDIVESEGHPGGTCASESGISLDLSVEHAEQLAIAKELPTEEFWGDWSSVGVSVQKEESLITPDLPDDGDEFWEEWVE